MLGNAFVYIDKIVLYLTTIIAMPVFVYTWLSSTRLCCVTRKLGPDAGLLT